MTPLVILALLAAGPEAAAPPPVAPVVEGTVAAPDGVPIRYVCAGAGPAVVLVHGWSCDASYWDATVAELAADHRVVAVDLAGHGGSGRQREHYTMEAFGGDVAAVLAALDLRDAVLVGHSMGGAVIVAAAVAAPDRVAGLIGVDTLHDLHERVTPEQLDAFTAPWAADFRGQVRRFVAAMFPAGADSAAVRRVAEDMAAAPPDVAMSAFRQMFAQDLPAAAARLRVPLWLIQADTYPTLAEGWRAAGVELHVDVIPGCGHFPQVTAPAEFHRLLRGALAALRPAAS